MKKIKCIYISDEEREALVKGFKEGDYKSLEDLIDDNEKQTLAILRQLKNIYEWKDIEDMVNYVSVIKKFETKDESVELEDSELVLSLKVFSGAVASGKVNGFALEKIVQVYTEFKNAK